VQKITEITHPPATMQSNLDVPRIIEGEDPFDDQEFAESVLASEEPPDPETEAKKKKLISLIYLSAKEKAPDATLQEVREMLMYKFGAFPERMDFMGLYEAARWTKTLEARIVNDEPTKDSDDV